jgi:hypothetical protein|tara:strand:- start:170 stop:544 length:375 start_codon:yes stop_codon:yes gene_type:complete
LAVLAACLKFLAVGAPLVPGFLIFSPEPAAILLRFAFMLEYKPLLAILAPIGYEFLAVVVFLTAPFVFQLVGSFVALVAFHSTPRYLPDFILVLSALPSCLTPLYVPFCSTLFSWLFLVTRTPL